MSTRTTSQKQNPAPPSRLLPLPQLPSTPRWAPSTPHAIQALQQRSGGRGAGGIGGGVSAGRRRKSSTANRPDSARNILRRLAKVTTAKERGVENNGARRVSTGRPSTTPAIETPVNHKGKDPNRNANRLSINSQDDEIPEKPDFTLPIDEEEEDEYADVMGAAPTRRELPGQEDYALTSMDFATATTWPTENKSPISVKSERIRGSSRTSVLLPHSPDKDAVAAADWGDDGDDSDRGDDTIQSVEFGRRAVSEGPAGWDRYPRSSFGSIRMSEFGLDESRLRPPKEGRGEGEASLILNGPDELEIDADGGDDMHLDIGGDTEDLNYLRRPSFEPVGGSSPLNRDEFLEHNDRRSLPFNEAHRSLEGGEAEIEAEDVPTSQTAGKAASSISQRSPDLGPQSFQQTTREEMADSRPLETSSTAPRHKRLKMTKKGNTVPSLPSSLIKKIAVDSVTRTGRKRPVVDRESLTALEQATEWFFEQVGEDLEVYSNHARGRKRVDDTDVVTLMKRQRVIGRERGLMELAEQILPDDVRYDLDLSDEV